MIKKIDADVKLFGGLAMAEIGTILPIVSLIVVAIIFTFGLAAGLAQHH